MATTAKELERLVITLVGSGEDYDKVLDEAVGNTDKAAKEIDKITSGQMGRQNRAMKEAARITESLRTPTQLYKRELANLNRLHRKGALSTEVHAKAVKRVTREYRRGANVVNEFGRKVTSVGRRLRNFGAIATIAVTVPALAMGSSFITAAADAEEGAAKFGEVFGPAADMVAKDLDAFAEAAGRGRHELRFMASDLGALIGPMGFTAEETGRMSAKLTKLATDLSSFFNIAERDALVALRAGLVGESEPLRRLGVQLSQAKIEAEAFASGLATQKSEVQGAVKAQAIMNLVMRQTKQAQGDAIRTSESYTNQMRALMGAVHDLRIEMGNYLLPMATAVVRKIKEWVQWFGSLSSSAHKTVMALAAVAAIVAPVVALTGMFLAGIGSIVSGLAAIGVTSFAAFGGVLLMAAKVIAIFGLVTMSIWIIADALTETELGFSKLLKTFRVGGHSIRAWIDAVAADILRRWESLLDRMVVSWHGFVRTLQEVGSVIWRAMLRVGKGISDAFWWAVRQAVAGVMWLARRSANVLNSIWLLSDEATANVHRQIDSINEAIADFGVGAGQEYETQINASLSKTDKRWKAHDQAVRAFYKRDEERAIHWGKVQQQVFEEDVRRHEKRNRKVLAPPKISLPDLGLGGVDVPSMASLPLGGLNALRGALKAPDVEREDRRTDFRQIALNRLSIAGLAFGGVPRKRQPVEAPGVESRLDQLIKATKARPPGLVMTE